MGFEIMVIIPKVDVNGRTKTQVGVIRTVGTLLENHEPALALMKALGYDLEVLCPEAMKTIENQFTGEQEIEFEGCGDVVEYTLEELEAAAVKLEEMALGSDGAVRALKLIDKTIKELQASELDKAEVCYF